MNSKPQQLTNLQSAIKPEIEVVQQIENAILDADAHLKARVKFEDIIIVLGTTKSGKSTLINFLIGNRIVAVKQKFGKTILVKEDDKIIGPRIGIDAVSVTTLPTKWVVGNESCINGLILWDAPGFSDSRGEIQDITNSFYIKTLLRGVKSAKIVLVTDFLDLYNDNVSSFVSLLESVTRIFNEDISSAFQSLVLIFNKTPSDCDEDIVNIKFLCELLTEKILKSESNIDKNCRSIASSLIECPERIGIFRRAVLGLGVERLNADIEYAIKSATPLLNEFLRNVSPSVSEKSQTFLLRQKFLLAGTPDIDVLLNGLEEKYRNISRCFKNEVASADKETLELIKNEIQRKLGEIQTIVANKGETLMQMLVKLQVIDKEGAGKAIAVLNLMNKATIIQHIDDILKLKESEEFRLKIEKIAVVVIKNLENVLIEITEKQGQINDQEAALRIAAIEDEFNREISEYEKKIEKLKCENQNKVANDLEKFGAFTYLGMAIDKAFHTIGSLLPSFRNKNASEVPEEIFSSPQIMRSCVVQSVADVRYANPLLNDVVFLQAFVKSYGAASTSRLVDLTNAIVSIGGDDEVQAIMSSEKGLEICFDLIRQGDY
ncbi:uncharacterized protein LOC136087730 [Hydra vulgaris]|uniref:Uncharacterized protein LOC136087730 n=1 Tax=Hydra vulgaris TaxID=6087 RepID=A0ABM4CZ37_HYDVU